MYADDLASIAFEDRKRPFESRSIMTVREFEQQFREAIQQRSQGGGCVYGGDVVEICGMSAVSFPRLHFT